MGIFGRRRQMHHLIITISVILLPVFSCKGQVETGNKYNVEFVVGEIPDSGHFLIFNENEKTVDSILNETYQRFDSLNLIKADTLIEKNRFINNRSRFLLTEIRNGIESVKDKDEIGEDGFSTICDCMIFKDTIMISSAIGLFAGAGVLIRVYGNQFKSEFYQYIDDEVQLYKLDIDDEFTDNVTVDSKYQYLQFDKLPNFTSGQSLTGIFTLTSKNFYESKSGGKTDTNYVKLNMHFTCLTKKAFAEP